MTNQPRRTLLGLGAAATGLLLLPSPRLLAQPATTTPALDVPYVPTPQDVVDRMLQLAKVNKNDILYDLGCGDGRIVVMAAERYGARGVGVDIDPRRIAEARANARRARVTERVEFRNEDLFTADFHDATVVTLFLWPDVNLKLRPRLLAELAPGTRVVSHWHNMGDWEPERTIRLGRSLVYLWRVPPRARSGLDVSTRA